MRHCAGLIPKVKTGKFGLIVNFDKATNVSLNLVIYAEFPATISQAADNKSYLNYSTGI